MNSTDGQTNTGHDILLVLTTYGPKAPYDRMKIQGFYNPVHILRTFLSHEYAFQIEYPKWVIRIAHVKGRWEIGKIQENKLIDYFAILDCLSGFEAKNPLTSGLIEKITEGRKSSSHSASRQEDAEFISEILRFWAGKFNSILSVDVVQPGRNSMVDEKTGELILSPRESEFKP